LFVFSPAKNVLIVTKPSVDCAVSRAYTEGHGRSGLLLAAKLKSVLDYKWNSSSGIASLIGVFETSYFVPPVAVLCQCVADVGGQESRACSELLVNASWPVG
jgi:hypothetical protein